MKTDYNFLIKYRTKKLYKNFTYGFSTNRCMCWLYNFNDFYHTDNLNEFSINNFISNEINYCRGQLLCYPSHIIITILCYIHNVQKPIYY